MSGEDDGRNEVPSGWDWEDMQDYIGEYRAELRAADVEYCKIKVKLDVLLNHTKVVLAMLVKPEATRADADAARQLLRTTIEWAEGKS